MKLNYIKTTIIFFLEEQNITTTGKQAARQTIIINEIENHLDNLIKEPSLENWKTLLHSIMRQRIHIFVGNHNVLTPFGHALHAIHIYLCDIIKHEQKHDKTCQDLVSESKKLRKNYLEQFGTCCTSYPGKSISQQAKQAMIFAAAIGNEDLLSLQPKKVAAGILDYPFFTPYSEKLHISNAQTHLWAEGLQETPADIENITAKLTPTEAELILRKENHIDLEKAAAAESKLIDALLKALPFGKTLQTATKFDLFAQNKIDNHAFAPSADAFSR